jgi:rhodanese-related sulfurtransferase
MTSQKLLLGRLLAMVLFSCGVVGVVWLSRSPLTWEDVLWRISQTYPTVRTMTRLELVEQLEGKQPPMLVDARTADEYALSHLPGAIWAAQWQPPSVRQPIVVYCSVGWRSAELCDQLQRVGYEQVWNLNGGIFAWAHAHLPLEQAGRAVRVVHPYNARWGELLDRELHPSQAAHESVADE